MLVRDDPIVAVTLNLVVGDHIARKWSSLPLIAAHHTIVGVIKKAPRGFASVVKKA